MKVLVTGSIAYDLLLSYDGSFVSAIDADHLEELSMAFVTPRFAKHHGGTGANIAWNLRLLNQDPMLVGTVGRDGEEYVAKMRERGIGTEFIELLPEYVTSTAIVSTDSHERQITFYHPGADAHAAWPSAVQNERDHIAYAIISPRDAKVMMQAVHWCTEHKVPYLFDPGQQVMALGEDELLRAIKGSRGVITNAYEWQLLSERTGFSTDALLQETPLLITTHGEDGLTLYNSRETVVLPACKAEKVVNPTGAGDALRAGILTGLAAKWPLRACGQLGAAMGSFVVEQEGTLMETLDLNALLGRAEVTYGEVLPALP